jgi:hypothetical protein
MQFTVKSHIDGKITGPHTAKAIVEAVESGAISGLSFVQREGEKDWSTINALFGFPEKPSRNLEPGRPDVVQPSADSHKPRSMLDAVQEVASRLIIRGYRKFASQHGCAPTSKTTDRKIIEIYTQVGAAFQGGAERRGERIPAPIKNSIVLHFLQLYEMSGDQFLQQHLQYETAKYLREGLRQDYNRELTLFDPNGDDPDVHRLRELQTQTREYLARAVPTKNNGTIYSKIANAVSGYRVAARKLLEREDRDLTRLAREARQMGQVPVELIASVLETAAKAFELIPTVTTMTSATEQAVLSEICAYYFTATIVAMNNARDPSGRIDHNTWNRDCTWLIKALASLLNDAESRGLPEAQVLEPLTDQHTVDLAMAYFTRNQDALQTSEQHVRALAEYDPRLTNISRGDFSPTVFPFLVRAVWASGLEKVEPRQERAMAISTFIVDLLNAVLELEQKVAKLTRKP